MAGCGGGSAPSSPPAPAPPTVASTPLTAVPVFGHIFLIVFENQGYGSIIGNPALPYLNSLATQYGLATNYYANQHASLGDYFFLTMGHSVQLDSTGEFSGIVTDDNAVRELVAGGKSWKVYAEGLPSVGYTGGSVFPYAKRHNPFAYFADVVNNPAQAANMVPFSQFAGDLANNSLPQYVYIVPNLQDDMHDCPAGMGTTCTVADKQMAGDNWLRANIGPLIESAAFKNDGLWVLTFDEAERTDTTNGGGRVATILIGSRIKPGYQSTTLYQHESTLRLTLEGLGIKIFPGKAASAPSMLEFFQ